MPATRPADASVTRRPALGLALWCVRAVVGGGSRDAPDVAAMSRADWAEFIRLAQAHGILPIAWVALRPFAADLSEEAAAELRVAYEANARRNLLLLGELRTVLKTLAERGITAVPWKGLVLAQRAYGDVALRQFFDLDLLVRRSQVAAARDVLGTLDFAPEKQMTDAEQETYVDHQGELELVRPTDGLWIEIHSSIVPTYYGQGMSSDELWRRLTTVELARTAVPALRLADEIEALCVHGSKHRWERLAWVLDVAMLARSIEPAEWSRLVAAAEGHGTLRMVRLGLLLAVDLCGAAIPTDVLDAARLDGVARSLALSATAALFYPRPNRFDALVFHARMRERSRDQLLYLLNVCFTPSGADWEALHLPRPLFPLYALTRPARLAFKYGRRLVSPPRG